MTTIMEQLHADSAEGLDDRSEAGHRKARAEGFGGDRGGRVSLTLNRA